MNITKLQIIEILKQLNVPYFTEGKNVSEDSVNIKCPFCADDPSDHLGIFDGNGVFSCWRCRKKGPLVYLIRKITGWSEDRCNDLVSSVTSSFAVDSIDRIKDIIDGGSSIRSNRKPICGLPKYFEKINANTILKFPLLKDYLVRRHIKLSTIIDHSCGICRAGEYMNRMIIPVIYNGSVVNFQAADLTGVANLKYKSASAEINNYLYNYDNIKYDGKMIIVEGVLDAWRVGVDAVATFGTHCTDRQLRLIIDKHPNEVVFCWDEDAYFRTLEYNSEVGSIQAFIPNVRLVKFPKGEDPDSYGAEYGEQKLMELINMKHEEV